MSGSLVADLGIGPRIWLFLTLLAYLTLFFKFTRFWSVRNLDLVLLLAPAPGLMALVGGGPRQPWWAFAWLFGAAVLWLARCLVDLGMNRRPLLEPNVNAGGLTCLAIGVLGLLVAETVSLPVDEGSARNPADAGATANPKAQPPPGSTDATVKKVLGQAPLPGALKRNPPQVILSRVLAGLAHLGLALALIGVGARHFDRPIAGLTAAGCYLLSPFTRIALVDSAQLVPACLVVAAVLVYTRPVAVGAILGFACAWMPACVGLIPLWAGFFRGRRALWFLVVALGEIVACALVARTLPGIGQWARALGARSLADAGLVLSIDNPPGASFWTWIDPSYRLPVLIAFFAFVGVTSFWPANKNLGQLIALSAAVLVASQFWYLDAGGTLILLYLPLILLMMFRPNLSAKRLPPLAAAPARGLKPVAVGS
jgi:hypothetical protein